MEEMGRESVEPLTAAVEREGEAGPLFASDRLRSAVMVGVTARSWAGAVDDDVGVVTAGVEMSPDVVDREGVESKGVTASCLISNFAGVAGVAADLAAFACLMTLWSTVN